MDYVDMGRRVRILRKRQHMTQEELAEKVDLSASYLGHIERGTSAASLETLVKLCEVLNTEPGYLLEGSTGKLVHSIPRDMAGDTRKKLIALLEYAYLLVRSEEEIK